MDCCRVLFYSIPKIQKKLYYSSENNEIDLSIGLMSCTNLRKKNYKVEGRGKSKS